jgi:hypothetical protein
VPAAWLAAAGLVLARGRHRASPGRLRGGAARGGDRRAGSSGAGAAPLSLAYGIGRLGCLLAGDGTYGPPSDLPGAMAFPNGAMPTTVPVHPTPLYEALAAFAIAGLTQPQLWSLALVVAGGVLLALRPGSEAAGTKRREESTISVRRK